jgi:hypothetical protein
MKTACRSESAERIETSKRGWPESTSQLIVAHRRSWNDIFSTNLERRPKERKRTKKKERGGPWNLPHLRKSVKVAFGNICLMIFTVAWKTLLGFPQLPPARRRLHKQQD